MAVNECVICDLELTDNLVQKGNKYFCCPEHLEEYETMFGEIKH
jgi:hypothetical protein